MSMQFILDLKTRSFKHLLGALGLGLLLVFSQTAFAATKTTKTTIKKKRTIIIIKKFTDTRNGKVVGIKHIRTKTKTNSVVDIPFVQKGNKRIRIKIPNYYKPLKIKKSKQQFNNNKIQKNDNYSNFLGMKGHFYVGGGLGYYSFDRTRKLKSIVKSPEENLTIDGKSVGKTDGKTYTIKQKLSNANFYFSGGFTDFETQNFYEIYLAYSKKSQIFALGYGYNLDFINFSMFDGNVYPYIKADLGFGHSDGKGAAPSNYALGIATGFRYNITDRIGLDFGNTSYIRQWTEIDHKVAKEKRSDSEALNIYLKGIYYFK